MGKNKDKGSTADISSELDDFESASTSGEYWSAKEYEGKVHLVKPYRLDPNAWGAGSTNPEAIIGDIVVLDERGDEHEVFTDAKIGGKALISQLTGPMGRGTRLVGRLQKTQGKGPNPYWSFQEATDADKGHARRFLSSANPL